MTSTNNKGVLNIDGFCIEKVVEEGTSGYDQVRLNFEAHKVVSKGEKYLVNPETNEALPFSTCKTSRGNEARRWKFLAANGEVAEVITETVPVKNNYPIYNHFIKHEDVPTFMDNLDADGNEIEVIDL